LPLCLRLFLLLREAGAFWPSSLDRAEGGNAGFCGADA
jgi:hypothetical protein